MKETIGQETHHQNGRDDAEEIKRTQHEKNDS